MLTKILFILVKQVPVSKHSTSNPKAYSKGRGSEKQLYYESPAFYIVMVVSDGLRSTFIWLKFQNFPGGASPQTPYNTVCYMCTDKCEPHTPHASHQSPLCIYTPFFILWINPWVVWIIWNSTYVWLCHRIQAEWSHSHICQVHEYITFINLVNKIVTVLINWTNWVNVSSFVRLKAGVSSLTSMVWLSSKGIQ